MSDDLVKRLRDDSGDWLTDLAADRIEELEAKLAKAVEALEKISKYDHQKTAMNALRYHIHNNPYAVREAFESIAATDIQSWAITTLAELKGEK